MSLDSPAQPETVTSESEPVKRAFVERRAFGRHECRAKVYYQTDELGLAALVEATPVNVSEAGICFKTVGPLAPKTVLMIEVHHAALQDQLKTQAEVIWAKAIDEKHYLVGCRWGRRLHSSELHQFL
jgi:hypothetical protein